VNYLGHLLVLPDHGLVTLGNLLGDFFKGRVEGIHPLDLRLGVTLHREIDRYTDQHPVVQRSIARLGPERRRVAGVLVDVFYDHFLARGLDVEAMRSGLIGHVEQLPEALRPLPARMITSGWLGSYASIEGIGMVLERMEQRRKRIVGLSGAETELRQHYEALAEDVREFYPDVETFTKAAIQRLRLASRAELREDAATESASDPPQSV
jgi:acyl carrier protein phosphodiesterase